MGSFAPLQARSFLAIDFETANYEPDSACALGLVKVVDGVVTHFENHLIRPPSSLFVFSYLHGITWNDVKKAPDFKSLWPEIEPLFQGVDFITAHNARFDKAVLNACLQQASRPLLPTPFECTVKWSRRVWNIRPTRLPDVCQYHSIPLNHHDSASDVLACARIMLRVLNLPDNIPLPPLKTNRT